VRTVRLVPLALTVGFGTPASAQINLVGYWNPIYDEDSGAAGRFRGIRTLRGAACTDVQEESEATPPTCSPAFVPPV
jgi:hypothetical protein